MANPPSVAGSPFSEDTLRARAEARETIARGRAAGEVNARQLEMARGAIAASHELLLSLRDPFRRLRRTRHDTQ